MLGFVDVILSIAQSITFDLFIVTTYLPFTHGALSACTTSVSPGTSIVNVTGTGVVSCVGIMYSSEAFIYAYDLVLYNWHTQLQLITSPLSSPS